jgi:GT2 family glycosyltransferase
VTVIVPVRNGEETIGACLASILRCDYPESLREVVVVDNASTDRTADIVRTYPVKYVHEPRRGRSHARNRGIQVSEGPVVAFTDADCIVARSWLRELVAAFDEEAVAAVAGEILPDPPRTPCQRYMAMRKPRWQCVALTSARPYAVTANVAFRRIVFDRIGAFDPRFTAGEDQDLSWRLLQAGLTLRYAPAAIVFHRHRPGSREFFKQQVGWAHGSWRLHSCYEGSGGGLAEGGRPGRLLRLIATCVRAGIRYRMRGGPEMNFYYPLFDAIRELAWCLGAAYSMVRALPVAFRPQARVKLDVRQWRIRHELRPPAIERPSVPASPAESEG